MRKKDAEALGVGLICIIGLACDAIYQAWTYISSSLGEGWAVGLMALPIFIWIMLKIRKAEKEAEIMNLAKEQQAKALKIRGENITKIVEQHIATLSRKRKQLLIADEYGVVNDKPWINEIDRFYATVVLPQVSEWPDIDVRILEREQFFEWISGQISKYSKTNPPTTMEYSDAMNPYDYERYCASLLSEIGWSARVTKASGDQGSDVIAEKNGLKIVLQCKLYTKSVGNKAIQEVFAAKSHEQASHAAVVTNQNFTRSARQIAATTGVDLLHHDQIQNWAKSLA